MLRGNQRVGTGSSLGPLLDAIRLGEVTDAVNAALTARVNPPADSTFGFGHATPVSLMPTRKQALDANVNHLSSISSPEVVFHRTTVCVAVFVTGSSLSQTPVAVPREYSRAINDMAPVSVTLKIGALVMLTRKTAGTNKGSVGRVTSIGSSSVTVKFSTGSATIVFSEKIQVTPDGKYALHVRYLPLLLAWALTVHRAQGMSADLISVCVDGRFFADGQVYVALSRCRSLEGLILKAWQAQVVRVSKTALQFYKDNDLL